MRIVKDYLDYYNSNVLEVPDTSDPSKDKDDGLRVAQVFINTDMRTWHKGLAKLCATHGINVDDLTPGQVVVFINNKRTKLKMYCANKIVAYLNNGQERLTFEQLSAIPEAFRGPGAYDLGQALRTEIYNLLEGEVPETKVESPAPAAKVEVRRSSRRA